jgi:hypothetical protein
VKIDSLKPNMTFATVTTTRTPRKTKDHATHALVAAIVPASTAPTSTLLLLPTAQRLSAPLINANRPMLELRLDVRLELIGALGQKDPPPSPHAQRNFMRGQRVEQVRTWVDEGLQVCCVEERCGVAFVRNSPRIAILPA